MPSTNETALRLIADAASAQRGLVTAAQIAEIGYARNSIRHRARQGGPWTRILPGIYLLAAPPLTDDQRMLAALLYAREPAMLTGVCALRVRGIDAAPHVDTPAGPEVHVVVPHPRRRISRDWVRVERTSRWPDTDLVDGLVVAPVARAAIDACRSLQRARTVQGLLTAVVQGGHTSPEDLRTELGHGQRQRTALAREALAIIERGPASPAEVALYERWTSSELPDALWNCSLFTPEGAFLARPDVYVPTAGVVVEVDSLAHHYERTAWNRTMERHARMTARGLLVIHVTPTRVENSWSAVCREVREAITSRAGHPPPQVVTRISDAA